MSENTNFGYQPNQTDSPLSPAGRFGRLSYLAWILVISILFYAAAIVVGLVFGVSAAAIGQAESGAFGGISIVAIVIFAVLYIALIYFVFVFAIRRLHDLNQSGWLSLLLLIPLVNIIFGLYILFGKGTQGVNKYGPQRITLGWEKVLGWIYIVLTVLSLIGLAVFSGSIINALSQTANLEQSGYSEHIDYSQHSQDGVTTEHETITETEPASETPATNP